MITLRAVCLALVTTVMIEKIRHVTPQNKADVMSTPAPQNKVDVIFFDQSSFGCTQFDQDRKYETLP